METEPEKGGLGREVGGEGRPGDGTGERMPLSQLLGALSFALDLTEGQPHGHAARSCLIGMRIADELRLSHQERSHLYYALILKDAGCSSNARATAALFGVDDQVVKREMKTVDWSRSAEAIRFALTIAGRGQGFMGRLRQVVKVVRDGSGATGRMIRLRCERGADIVRALGFPGTTAEAVRCLDEHWDGGGEPDGLSTEEIPLMARILGVSQTVEVFAANAGWPGALKMARSRAGTWFDPELVRALESLAQDTEWCRQLYGTELLSRLAEVEPPDQALSVDADGIDRVAEAFAEVVDAKTPFTFRHSARVALVARAMAETLEMPPAECRDVYRAGLLHDIGKLGVSNRILDKAGSLTEREREEVERHPVLTWTILGQVEAFAGIARMASLHHERLDGAGYPWGIGADELDRSERILCAADVFEALTADRPYRDRMEPERALGILRELEGEALDPEMVRVLEELEAQGEIPAPDEIEGVV